MAVEIFTKEDFEKALPVNKNTGEKLWDSLGVKEGEFAYKMPLGRGLAIHIRSSVKSSGVSASTGKDSIRFWVYKELTGKPHGSKTGAYVTRVKGWEGRMLEQLRKLWHRGTATDICSHCGGPKAVFRHKTKKILFQACPVHFHETYEEYTGI